MTTQELTGQSEPIDTAEPTRLVSAFVNETRQPGRGRLGPRVWAGIAAVLLVAGLAVGFGAMTRPAAHASAPVVHRSASPQPSAPRSPAHRLRAKPAPVPDPKPSASHEPPAVAPAVTTPQVTFSALAGYRCATTATASFKEFGRYTDGAAGFVEHRTGGWGTEGCEGKFDSMPVSGDATADDPENYALWTFHPGTATDLSCKVTVFTPNDAEVTDVGGDPASYQVYAAADATGSAIGSFTIDQTTTRNTWVPGGVFRVSGGVVTVKVDSRGADPSGVSSAGAHIAIAQVRVTCTG